MKFQISASALLALSVFAQASFGHSLYLMPQKFRIADGESILVSIHNGDSFPFSEGSVDPVRLSYPPLLQANWMREEFRIVGKATHGFIKPASSKAGVFALSTAPRRLDLAPDKFESYLRLEGLDAIIEQRKQLGESAKDSRESYAKHAKTFIQSADGKANWATVASMPLEIIPENDPTIVTASGLLPVRVLWNGKPATGVRVVIAWAKTAKSGEAEQQLNIAGTVDAKGRVMVPVDKAGVWRIQAVAMRRAPAGVDADWQSDWASYTFQVDAASVSQSKSSLR